MSGEITKTSWPEVKGLPSEAAKRKILNDRPDVHVDVVADGSLVTTDFNYKRVRIFVDKADNVAKVPKIG